VRGVIPATSKGEPPPQDLEPLRALVKAGAIDA
jgi:hypothetical protein